MLNNILIVVSLLALAVMLFMMYQKSKSQQEFIEEEDFDSIDKVVEAVKLEMVEIIKDDYSLGLTEAEFNALYKRKARIQEALRNCVYGIDSAKIIVIELIRTFIAENIPIETLIYCPPLWTGLTCTIQCFTFGNSFSITSCTCSAVSCASARVLEPSARISTST